MLIRRKYWKWNKAFNSEKFNLGDEVAIEDIGKYLSFEKKEDGQIFYKIKNEPFVNIITNNENKIIQKSFGKGSIFCGLEMNPEFQGKTEAKINQFLETCEESYQGEKLLIFFGDAMFGMAILVA